MTKKEIEKLIIDNCALLTTDEGEFLFNLARQCHGDIIEIGSYLGGSTIILAKGLREPFKVYSVDSHVLKGSPVAKNIGQYHTVPENPLEVFHKNIMREGVRQKIIHIVKESTKAAGEWEKKRKIGLLWIDGDHEYSSVKKDFIAWEPFLEKGGIIAFHDSFYGWNFREKLLPAFQITHDKYEDGPERVVKEHVVGSARFGKIRTVDTITCAVKTKGIGMMERLINQNAARSIDGRSPSLVFRAALKIDRALGLAGIFLRRFFPDAHIFKK